MFLQNGRNLFGFLCIILSQQITCEAQIQVVDGLASESSPEVDFPSMTVFPRGKIVAWEKPLSRLVTSTPKHVQEEAVRALIRRLLPTHQHLFVVKVNSSFTKHGKDCFKIVSPRTPNDNRVGITGTTGVAVAWGLLHYLKYFCGAHVSWEADQLDLPDPLPRAFVKIAALDRLRYYQNVCTSSYSFAWWNWARWERHIDWMALNGINFPLAFTAQEEIWRRVYTKFNFTQEELDDHFVGPAFLAWGRMGNIQKWMGPLSDNWHNQTLALQHHILRRMRNLGMIPILPAFAGHVPSSITRIFPEANVTQLRPWGHFIGNYTRTYFLDPQDKLFSQIGTAFIEEMRKEFNGTDHFYNCDTFNEMVPPSWEAQYLRSVGKAVLKAMTIADPQAIWVMQGWLFRNKKFWTRAASKALLTSIPQGRMVVLDLASDVNPQYSRLDSYFGQPFIFCMLHDFGGVNGLYGNVEVLLKNMADARSYPNVTMVGTGLTPEGINQNYVLYDLMLELSWRKKKIDITQWAHDYSRRRYGCRSPRLTEAWGILMATVYNSHMPMTFHGTDILIQHRPDFVRKATMWYKDSDMVKVWDLFLSATNEAEIYEGLRWSEDNAALAEPDRNTSPPESLMTVDDQLTTDQEVSGIGDVLQNNSTDFEESGRSGQPLLIHQQTFRHDLVDFSRQVLQVLGGNVIEQMRMAYTIKSLHDLNETGTLLLDLLDDMDLLLGTSKEFLYGSWLHDATTWAANQQEKEKYLLNARYQVTLWGPNGEILDYAVKQWSGIVRDYMKPRYALFLEQLSEALKNDEDFSQEKFNTEVFVRVEKPFADGVNGGEPYPFHPQGDLIATVKRIYHKYRRYFDVRQLFNIGKQEKEVSEKSQHLVWIKYFWKRIITGNVM